MPSATVIGAGVSGMTSAACLLEAGWDVNVVASDTWESTVSRVAAAVWTITDQEPRDSVRRWAIISRERFADIAEREPQSGVAPLRQRELERIDPGPSWWESTPYARRMSPSELPEGYAAGWDIDGFIIEPPRYLPWLLDQVQSLGGIMQQGTIGRLEDVEGDLVVNCAGLAGGALADDPTMYPIRGQVVAVANPGIREGVADESDVDRVTYVYPRSEEIVLGGTRQSDNSNPDPDPATTQRILADCTRLDGRVGGLEVLDVRVGFRPGRPSVRVQRGVLSDGRTVVHNYGHAGAGFILSWGCGQEVVELAAAP